MRAPIPAAVNLWESGKLHLLLWSSNTRLENLLEKGVPFALQPEADCFSCHMSARPEHSMMQTVCSALVVFSCPCNHNEILVRTPIPGGCRTMSKVSTSKSESMDLSWKRVECRRQPGNELLPHEEECKSYRVFVHQWGDRGGNGQHTAVSILIALVDSGRILSSFKHNLQQVPLRDTTCCVLI